MAERPLDWPLSAGDLDVRGVPFPPYVRTEEERRRWDQCTLVSLAICALNEADPGVTRAFVWYFTREVYNDRAYQTGTAAELMEMKEAAIGAGFIHKPRGDGLVRTRRTAQKPSLKYGQGNAHAAQAG